MVTWLAPRADKVSKIVLKVSQEDFGNTSKEPYWLHLPFFHEFFFGKGGGTTPQMLLTVKKATIVTLDRQSDTPNTQNFRTLF